MHSMDVQKYQKHLEAFNDIMDDNFGEDEQVIDKAWDDYQAKQGLTEQEKEDIANILFTMVTPE